MAGSQLIGQKFGRLTVEAQGARPYHWLCRCDCGASKEVKGGNLTSGRTGSCGCFRTERPNHVTHGATGTLTHKRWRAMRARCMNPNADGYANYGGRGIVICERWDSFENFLADMGECPGPAFTIERSDTDGNYEPSNCRWATKTEQARNTRANRMLTHDGLTLCVSEWAERIGLPSQTILNRLRYGWSVERTLTETGDARVNRKPRSNR